MKKTAITFTAILFVCVSLLLGQAFAMHHGEMENKKLNRASEIMGQTVINQQDEELGDVENLLFDDEGNIKYIILSRGGVMGVGAESVPIPWKAQNIKIQDDAIVIDIEKKTFEEAPSFSSGEWETLQDQEFQQRVKGHYNGERYEK